MNNKTIHPASCVIESSDIKGIMKMLKDEFVKDGYGVIFSTNPIKYILVENNKNGLNTYKEIYELSIIWPNYATGGYIVEPIGEWESYLESLDIYDSSDIEIIDNIKERYKKTLS